MSPKSFCLACCIVLASVTARAQQQGRPWMGEPEIRSAFSGRTIEGHYANGEAFTESYLVSGRIDYRERGRALSGRWSVEAGAFCTIYDTSPTGGCFRVRQMSANCFEFYFVARDEADAATRPGRPSWTARGWQTDHRSTCEDGANV